MIVDGGMLEKFPETNPDYKELNTNSGLYLGMLPPLKKLISKHNPLHNFCTVQFRQLAKEVHKYGMVNVAA